MLDEFVGAILLRECGCFQVWTHPSLPSRKLGTFGLFKLPALLWETYLLKWKVVYLKCYKGSDRTLFIYVNLQMQSLWVK